MADSLASTTPTTADLREPLQPAKSRSLDADIIIKNAPDPVFVSDLEGSILTASDHVYELLTFSTDELPYQSISRFISPEETREFTGALRVCIGRGVIRNTRFIFLCNDGAATEIYLLSLPVPLPVSTAPAAADLREPLQAAKSRSLDADIIIKNAPDPVFVSDLEGRI